MSTRSKNIPRLLLLLSVLSVLFPSARSFLQIQIHQQHTTSLSRLNGWLSGGTGSSKESLDEEWRKQQEILKFRRSDSTTKKAYFDKIEKRRVDASKDQEQKWGWQTKNYKKGEDPLTEWKKRRKSGQISDLEDQYGDPKKIGGIPLPSASFGVGGEFGVGGKFDNGGRFDLRLPYADQGYVDEDAGFKWPWEKKKQKKEDKEKK
ncbi:hypothetical protein TrVE_jg12764 [Triparma verrucosa]|uniref:Uncharacterized protein n=1 Tax=Triparma verrucosa TaxID=1606542 RepID=A0A9W7CJX5_9STRA|nr:hypothetical protein TrVE_jg12764 [Triparma verrucosa]